jgi:hypothetical protein
MRAPFNNYLATAEALKSAYLGRLCMPMNGRHLNTSLYSTPQRGHDKDKAKVQNIRIIN